MVSFSARVISALYSNKGTAVQASSDFMATTEEDMDFHAGDIIGVTSTSTDGWWSGELSDEARRRKGRHVFPCNFVKLMY